MNKKYSLLKKIIAKIISLKQFFVKDKQIITIKPVGVNRGSVLISYLIEPFRGNKITISNKHTNEWECVKIVNIFVECGYTRYHKLQ